jgi:hypothetical protein
VYLRDITQKEKHMLSEYKEEINQLSRVYNEETEKSFRELKDDDDYRIWESQASPEELLAARLMDEGMPMSVDDFEHIEHRISSDWYFGPQFEHIQNDVLDKNQQGGWNPYEQDLSLYPEIYKMYGENHERYERAKKKFEDEDFSQADDPYLKRRYPKNMDAFDKRYDDFMPRFSGTSMQ